MNAGRFETMRRDQPILKTVHRHFPGGFPMMSSIRWAATVLLAAGAVLTHDPARASAVSVSGSGCSADGLCLRVTVAVDDGDPAQCGTQTDLVAISGDIVNYCYIVTNGTNVTLRAHSLSDSANGTLFEYFLHDLPPGASYQYNRRETVSTSMQSTASWTATDAAPAYASSAAAFDFVDISASGTPLNLGDNDAAFVQLPFPFVYYGTSFETLCVNNNGLVIPGFVSPFGPQACGGFSDHAQIPVPFPVYADNPFIAPLWTDLSAVYGNVYVGTVGEAPDRRYVIEWSGVSSDYQVQDTGTATFEIVLSEADGTIAYQYQDVTFDDPTAPPARRWRIRDGRPSVQPGPVRRLFLRHAGAGQRIGHPLDAAGADQRNGQCGRIGRRRNARSGRSPRRRSRFRRIRARRRRRPCRSATTGPTG
jgi:hypothetical protein